MHRGKDNEELPLQNGLFSIISTGLQAYLPKAFVLGKRRNSVSLSFS
ncbi:hypothetical protein Lepto7375DRAFT_7857 [Leptolyngbya sp. PCC 7375]|nr:hypothetical protein Lepto7375DRAFT_7857 [Leptolyngbya sp. PCC 7375]